MGGSSYRAAVYYANWATYARDYQPYDLPTESLTHVFYAFANISSKSGEVSLSDEYADVEKRFPSDSGIESDENLYGCLKQLFLMKKRNRKLKTILSIGGSTFSKNMGSVVSTEEGRQCFAQSAVKLLGDLGFDGLDIDWEYPTDDADAYAYVALLSAVRKELDAYSLTLPHPSRFLLTVATSCGPEHYQRLRLSEMDPFIDFWNLMAYDFTGPWSTLAGHQTNVFPSEGSEKSTPFSAEAAVEYYTNSTGIMSDKIVLGMPLYGRVFANTVGPGSTYTGVDDAYDWEIGVWDYKIFLFLFLFLSSLGFTDRVSGIQSLPRPGAVEHFDRDVVASWSYDPTNQVMVTYDNLQSAKVKADYVKQRNLGGAMWWESSGDRTDESSLIKLVANQYAEVSQRYITSPSDTKFVSIGLSDLGISQLHSEFDLAILSWIRTKELIREWK
ncbi:glycoside hydrolase [Aureobasidium pullulans]|uniref:chitinase n=1 Tax=Aureobasidium pullulans TaxID=5580 RepID=A0A4T0B3V6_AURPU|nr:glycoside hydrolase [Aureobasidium pullulans]